MRYLFPSARIPKLNPNSGQAQDLLAWYPITKYDSATRLVDHSGNKNDALVSAGAPLINGTVRGIAADFRNASISNYIASLTIPAAHTVCVRYYGTADAANSGIWTTSNGGTTDDTALLANTDSSNNFGAYADTFLPGTVNSASRLNSWVDLIVTTDDTNERKLYVDGKLDAIGDLSTVAILNTFIIGSYTETGTLHMEGFLKDVRLYGKVFTDAEAFAYSNPATQYDLWAKPLRSRRVIPVLGGFCTAPSPIVNATIPVDGSGTGTISTILPVVSGTGLQEPYGSITQPLPVVSGTVLIGQVHIGAVISGAPSIIGTGFTGDVGSVDIQMPISTCTSTLLNGGVSVGAVNAPLNIVTGVMGSHGTIQLPIAVVAASGLTGRVGTGSDIAPAAQVTGVLVQTAYTIGDIVLPDSIVSGDIVPGTVNAGEVEAKLPILAVTGLSGGVSTGAITAPILTFEATLISEVFSIGDVIVSLPIVNGTALNDVAAFIAWALNTESNRTTNYTQFPFIALGHMGVNPVGATADGIYLLTGDNDDGQPIDATFKFGMTDFRSQLADVSDVYIGGDIEGDMEIGILEDGQDVENIYPLFERERHVRGHHAKLGKGFRSRYRQLSISNVNGGNFELDSLTLPPRDLKGNE